MSLDTQYRQSTLREETNLRGHQRWPSKPSASIRIDMVIVKWSMAIPQKHLNRSAIMASTPPLGISNGIYWYLCKFSTSTAHIFTSPLSAIDRICHYISSIYFFKQPMTSTTILPLRHARRFVLRFWRNSAAGSPSQQGRWRVHQYEDQKVKMLIESQEGQGRRVEVSQVERNVIEG